MNKVEIGMYISIAIAVLGLALLSYQSLTDSAFHKIGVLYGLIFGVGVMASITLFKLRETA